MTTQKEKPPAQVAGVQGFNAFTTPADEVPQPQNQLPPIDWQRLAGLPPFQMFVAEHYPEMVSLFDGTVNVTANWVKQMITEKDSDLYQRYCDWHAAKGYWKGETPMGEVVNNV